MGGDNFDGEYAVIKDKGEIGFIDFEDDKSVTDYDPNEEGPVIISVPFPFIKGKPQSPLIGETSVQSITLNNTTDEPVELWGVRIYCSNPTDSFTLSIMKPPPSNSNLEGFIEGFSLEDRVLQPRRTLTIWLSCKPKEIGLHTSAVHFDVGDDRIERVVFLLAEDKVSQSIASNRPYSRNPRIKKHFGIDDYVDSVPPAKSGGSQRWSNNFKLPNFPISKDVRKLVENKKVPVVLTESLFRENYAAFFSTLINMEELHLEEEIRCHDMENVTMRKRGRHLLALEVPGLAERRPSLVHGDHVFAMLASHQGITPYRGCIYRVEADEVLLRFADEFHAQHCGENLYNVRFTYNRLNMRRQYHAVHAAADHLDADFLFPSQSMKRRSITTTPFVPFNFLNEEQMQSVEVILGCKGAPPYAIHGPPGTGKTMTIIEAILQLYKTKSSVRILVCAASNSAADDILEKLIHNDTVGVKENEIFRLNATSRAYEDVQPDNIRFCYFEGLVFKCPPLNALLRYKVIVSTYMSTSLIFAEGLRRGHFSHIFLDEAGQASEPEAMIPIANLCRRDTVVVLAGDPMQLGPVVFSKKAEDFGLGKSYLGRLFECEFYSNEDENYVTKLVRNYRSHPAILDLPSKLFYGGDLLACKEDASLLINSELDFLPSKDFPLLFIGIQGCDEREGNNPSWFNRIEASKVVDIIKKLTSRLGVSEADIGVITPYRQQVLKLNKILESLEIDGVKVGSVEQFQGQEKEVIIISTVRSTVKHNRFDQTHCLGFLSHPRRFNVAITRAKSLLVIIGNPHIVCQDPYWDKLLTYCSDNNSYQGCPLPEKQEQVDEKSDMTELLNSIGKSMTESLNFMETKSHEVNKNARDIPKQDEDIPKPVFDEAEWSDGWK